MKRKDGLIRFKPRNVTVPGLKNRKADEHRQCSAVPNDLPAIDCLSDNVLRGVAAPRTYLGGRTTWVGFVERELVCGSPSED